MRLEGKVAIDTGAASGVEPSSLGGMSPRARVLRPRISTPPLGRLPLAR